jgi:enamine deaminase RidA (YjgF/YER057c/UK114 family)
MSRSRRCAVTPTRADRGSASSLETPSYEVWWSAVERQTIDPWTWQDPFGFVQATAVTGGERTIYCAGQTSMDADGNRVHEGDMRAQLRQAVDNLEAVLRESDCELSDVVRLNYYTTDVDGFFAEQDRLFARLNEAGCRPASTILGVSRLALRRFSLSLRRRPLREQRGEHGSSG